MPTKPLVIYHANCWDGFCAAWVVRKEFGDIEAVPAHYGTPPPDVTGRQVFVVDFCYPRAVLAEMADAADSLVVLDHHKTAEPELVDVTHDFDLDRSGGRIAWDWFRNDKAPWLVDYTEDRDLWRHKLDGTHEINAALRSYPLDFELWDNFEQKDPRSTFYFEGVAIRRREKQIVDDHVRNATDKHEFGFFPSGTLVVNATVLFSEIAGELAKCRPFGACYFDRKDGKRQWSLRSDENGVDVSAIAKSFGGGGHVHAAGFEQ